MSSGSVMRRLARPAGEAGPVLISASSILARAMRRACDRSGGLDVHIADAGSRELSFEDAIGLVDPNDLLIELTQDGSLAGCVVVSTELRAAIVEAQTLGAVNNTKAEARPASGADAALCMPVLIQLCDELRPQAAGTQIEGWLDHLELGQRLSSTRILELTLTDERLGCIEVVCKIIGTKREARLYLLVPLPSAEAAAPVREGEDWVKLWRPVAQEVPAKLEAILHRMVVGVAQVEQFKEGDLVPLTGAKVTDLRLIDGTGAVVTNGRLGQMSGFRAIRVEMPPAPEMSELPCAAGLSAEMGLADEISGIPEIGDIGSDDPAGFGGGDLEMPTMEVEAADLGGDLAISDMPALDGAESDAAMDFELPDMGESPEILDLDGALPEGGDNPMGLDLDGEMPGFEPEGSELPDLDLGGAAPLDMAPMDLDSSLDLDMPDPPAFDLDGDITLPE